MKKALALLCTISILFCALCACSAEGEVSETPDRFAGEFSAPGASKADETEEISQESSEEGVEESSEQHGKNTSLPEVNKPSYDQTYPIGYNPEPETVYLPDGNFVYVALGDSIASGYALNDPKRKCYGALFAAMCGECDYRNYAVKGYETDDTQQYKIGTFKQWNNELTAPTAENTENGTKKMSYSPIYTYEPRDVATLLSAKNGAKGILTMTYEKTDGTSYEFRFYKHYEASTNTTTTGKIFVVVNDIGEFYTTNDLINKIIKTPIKY